MSGQLKEVRIRIKSVISTQQITKAMKMVSAAKLRKAQDAIIQMRPYSNQLNEILSNIAGAVEGDIELQLAEEREVEKVLIIAISSDRGLAGNYNSTIIKLAWSLIAEKYATQHANGDVTLMTIGKKVFDYYRKRFDKVQSQHTQLFQTLDFEHVCEVVDEISAEFIAGEYDKVEVVYSHFKNAGSQVFMVEQFLPIVKPEKSETTGNVKTDFIFEPSLGQIIHDIVPKILRTQFFKYMLEANASEHGARMTAMDKATENANELLKELRLKYNRARQDAITTELSEIVGGAAALQQG